MLLLLEMLRLGSEGEWHPSRPFVSSSAEEPERLLAMHVKRQPRRVMTPREWGSPVSGNRCATHSQQLYPSHSGLVGDGPKTIPLLTGFRSGSREAAILHNKTQEKKIKKAWRDGENSTHIYRINIYPNSAREPTPAASLDKDAAGVRSWRNGIGC